MTHNKFNDWKIYAAMCAIEANAYNQEAIQILKEEYIQAEEEQLLQHAQALEDYNAL